MLVEPTIGQPLPLSNYQALFQFGAGINILLTVFEQLVLPLESRLSHLQKDVDVQLKELAETITSDQCNFWYEKVDNPRPRDEIKKHMLSRLSALAYRNREIDFNYRSIKPALRRLSTCISTMSFMCFMISLGFLFVSTIYPLANNWVITSIGTYVLSTHRAIIALSTFVFLPITSSFVLAGIVRWIILRQHLSKLRAINTECKVLYSEIRRPGGNPFANASPAKRGRFSGPPSPPPPHIRGLMQKKSAVTVPQLSDLDSYINKMLLKKERSWKTTCMRRFKRWYFKED